MLSVTGINNDIFLNSSSIRMIPSVSAEWNQNIFNPPYATLAGDGTLINNLSTNATLTTVTDSNQKVGFTTKSYSMTADGNSITYTVTPTTPASAFKIITYIKTNSSLPIMANFSAKGTSSQYGSSNEEINSFGYSKVETYIGSSSYTDSISSFTFTITLNRFSTDDQFPIIYFTQPEVYAVDLFNYMYNSTWPSDSVFTNFRPGESYVTTGNTNFQIPTNFRKVNTSIISGYTTDTYMPVSPIMRSPGFFNVNPPVPIYKNALATDINQYKYFVSDSNGSNRSITGLYNKSGIAVNKIVIKFNNIVKVPIINIKIDNNLISVDGSSTIDLTAGGVIENNGVLILYWNGTGWTRNKWSSMPKFQDDGQISIITSLSKITVTEINKTVRPEFSYYSSTDHASDMSRLQIIEISPRVEIDLTSYVMNVSINKALDSKETYMPISGMSSDDAQITLSAIPLGNISAPIPIFSNQSNYSGSVLKNMLRKNIKFYINFYLDQYVDSTNSNVSIQKIIPGGVFYSDSWSESDINQISIQSYDITRYLQYAPVADYVANLKSVFEIVSNILDLSGFTDYDYDSLYDVCLDKNISMDISYYFANSKDTTIIDALNQILLPYQIGGYIDEYGILKFLSLSKILSQKTSNMNFDKNNVIQNGYSVNNKAKPGKISLRYQSPKIKQSLALQNATIPDIANGQSFIYTTSNDVVWSQQNADSVGFNYLYENCLAGSNKFKLNPSDLLDVFHTFSLNNNGYAAIENEIVSFVYKEYQLSNQTHTSLVNVKNDIELAAEVNRFNKKYQTGLVTSNGNAKTDYNVVIGPTGNITNVKRGLFGTVASDHLVLNSSNFASKGITTSNVINNVLTGSSSVVVSSGQIQCTIPVPGKTIVYPSTERSVMKTQSGDAAYQTYSGKFNFNSGLQLVSGGVFFNMPSSGGNTNGTFYVELIKANTKNDSNAAWNSPAIYNYYIAIYNISGGTNNLIAWTDVTNTVGNIINNFEVVLVQQGTGDLKTYTASTNPAYQTFKLKVVSFISDGSDGETAGGNLCVFLNNHEINGWQTYQNGKWQPIPVNQTTGLFKKVSYSGSLTANTIFGTFLSLSPITIPGVLDSTNGTYPTQATTVAGGVREIYATYKPLRERSVSYYFQDREFLNGLVQNQNVFNKSKSYMMQTTPEVIGINYYDVQYTTPAAVSVDVLPIEYLWAYFPGMDVTDQKYLQYQEVDEYSLAYSTPINTGFRAKLAVANNSNHMVYLKKDSDQLNQFTVYFNLWTHEIIANSDPEIIEKIIDNGNYIETIQLDSPWIQSKESANKMLNLIGKGIDNFSKDITLEIFGNPLIQIGDVVTLTYNLTGLNQQKYVVHSVSHSFSEGLSTRLTLNMIDPGISY